MNISCAKPPDHNNSVARYNYGNWRKGNLIRHTGNTNYKDACSCAQPKNIIVLAMNIYGTTKQKVVTKYNGISLCKPLKVS